MRECLLALMFVSASVVGYAASAGPSLSPQDQKATTDDGAKKQLVATVVSVDPDNKIINFKELRVPVAITENTVFDDEVQLSKLKAGTKVKLVLIVRADNQAEAVEIHSAG